VSFPTVAGQAVEGLLYREAQSCLGTRFANSFYLFFLSGTATPVAVYRDGNLTTPFPSLGRVFADGFGRFPPIYLDPSTIYRVQFFNQSSMQQWQVDPYISQLSTVGTSALSAFGVSISPTGELTIPAPNSGGIGSSLTLLAGALGSIPLQISSTLPGNSALIANSSATTGAQTATFVATNKPGTATSSPAGWLPITADGVQYYTPIWHGNPFTPYGANPSAQGEMISAQSVLFGGDGLTTATGGTATPSNWFSPTETGVGAGFFINITKTGGLSGIAFTAAQGAFTNIGAGGLTISSNAQATITGTYRISSSGTGSPVVATGTISLSNNNGVQSPTINGAGPVAFGSTGFVALAAGTIVQDWFLPHTAGIGAGFFLSIMQTGGTGSFTGISGVTNISSGGLSVGVTGPGGTVFSASGTYTISSDAGGTNQLGQGSISLTGGSNVQSPNWSGATPLRLNGDGSATLNGVSAAPWFSPNAANTGSGFWINITRTGGTSGVNFTAAQGSFTNITNGGLTIDITGFTGDVGVVNATGSWQISSSASGTPVLGSGTITLSVNAGTVTHSYPGPTSGTETVPTNSSSVFIEAYGAGAGGSVNSGSQAGGGGAYSRINIAVAGGQTMTFSSAGGGAGATSTGLGANGGSSTVSGTVAGGTVSMTAGGGLGSGAGGSPSGGDGSSLSGGAGTTSASGAGAGPLGGAGTANGPGLPATGNAVGGGGAVNAFTPTTTNFTTSGTSAITIPSGATSMTLEIFGGGGGGTASSTTLPGEGGASGGRCVSTVSLAPSNAGQSFSVIIGQVSSGGNPGFTSFVTASTFTGAFTAMSAAGGGGGGTGPGGSAVGGAATGGNVSNTTGNGVPSGQQAGGAGLATTVPGGVPGKPGASGANPVGGMAHPATLGTIGQGTVIFSGGTAQNGAAGLVMFTYS
jgi:hypothetical protein